MRLNVDEDFTNFVKNRLMERTLVEGDTTLVMMLGHAIPFTVSKTRPHGIVKVTAESRLTILNEPAPEAKGLPTNQLRRHRWTPRRNPTRPRNG